MRSLTTQQRLTLLFTLYFSVFLVVLGTLFIGMFRIYYLYQIRKDLTHEFTEVVVDHIGMDERGIFFKKDKNGDTLRTHLFNDGVSALFLDTNNLDVRNYGVFETNKNVTFDRGNIITAVNQSVRENKVKENTITWDGGTFTAFITPLKYNSRVVGSMVLAKSHTDMAKVEESIVVVLGVLGTMGLLGSFVLGFAMTRNALSPLRKVISTMEATHLHKLESKVDEKGNPEDELVILARKFNEMLSRLNLMSSRQKEFIANASHELKTPLTRAILSLDNALMQDTSLPAEVRDAKEDLWELNNLLEQLLVLGRVKEGALPKGEVMVSQAFHTVLKRYESELKHKNITMRPYLEDFSVPVPPEYVQIIISNLLSNALKYSSPSSSIDVHLSAKERTFSLRDTGVGMTEEELSQLFERFYRGKSIRHTTRGYGLGLSLVKEICDEYHIEAHYESEKGKGTTVVLTFPA